MLAIASYFIAFASDTLVMLHLFIHMCILCHDKYIHLWLANAFKAALLFIHYS